MSGNLTPESIMQGMDSAKVIYMMSMAGCFLNFGMLV
jgi:hypothetical protein